MYNFILCFLSPHPLWLEGTPLPTERAPVLTAEIGPHPQTQGTALPRDGPGWKVGRPTTEGHTAHQFTLYVGIPAIFQATSAPQVPYSKPQKTFGLTVAI